MGILPAVIILTKGDDKAYLRAKGQVGEAVGGAIRAVLTSVGAILLNVIASYIYAILTS